MSENPKATPEMTALLEEVKRYMYKTWDDDPNLDGCLTGYIKRGMERLQAIAGAPINFSEDLFAQGLLLDYCRYADSRALEVFEQNFSSELLTLHFNYQAPLQGVVTDGN